MKIIIFLGLLGATLSAPLIPRHLMSASNSNELLLNLNNGQLLPLRLQGPLASWIPPFSGIPLPQQAPIPGHSQISLSTLDQFVGPYPNEIPFPRQVSFVQGAQTGQLDPSQPQAPSQTQPGPNPVLPYVFPFKTPQEQAQTNQYYPVYMFLPWEQPQQTATQSPQQTGPQQFEEQIPFYAQYGYITQPAETGVTERQQQSALDPLLGTVPETVLMPGGGVIPYLQKEVVNLRPDNAGVFMHSTSPKPSTANVFTSGVDPTIASMLPEEKAKTDSLREP
ncbi:PREDICTED: odontogenic ameloblast-associated protein [Chinchilla lanigera]|uniref:Odontogenic ameloblast-associated protein n=1 Tax=Chinchilla lanigera TaxID=34839 RepID=A0A8C2VCS9_CHILA|nr:PREDICTED: odontogenic ameloblast-associated protein [Chinchilla lanigera]